MQSDAAERVESLLLPAFVLPKFGTRDRVGRLRQGSAIRVGQCGQQCDIFSADFVSAPLCLRRFDSWRRGVSYPNSTGRLRVDLTGEGSLRGIFLLAHAHSRVSGTHRTWTLNPRHQNDWVDVPSAAQGFSAVPAYSASSGKPSGQISRRTRRAHQAEDQAHRR